MKTILFCLSLMIGITSVARADELADAAKALEGKSYAQAMQIYTRLASAGNPVAQLHLGEMYWYGEGTPVDLAAAEGWFKKSAAAGNPQAAAALGVMKQRELRRTDIDFWVAKYDGADLKAGKFDCKRPDIPAVSKTNSDIKDISAAVAAWQQCYNGFVANLNDALPPGKRIPADLANLMNEQEYDAAVARLDKLYAKLSADEMTTAKATLAAHAAWRHATEAYAVEANRLAADRKISDLQEVENMRRQNERAGMGTIVPYAASKK